MQNFKGCEFWFYKLFLQSWIVTLLYVQTQEGGFVLIFWKLNNVLCR